MAKNKIFWIKVGFVGAGAFSGFLYWKFIGCTSGTCPIRSVWYLSTFWGAAMGYLPGDLLGSYMAKRESKHE